VTHKPGAYLTGLWIISGFCSEASCSCSRVAASLAIPDCCDDNDDVLKDDTEGAASDEAETAILGSEFVILGSEFVFVCCCCDARMFAALLLSCAAHVLHGHEAITSSRKHNMVYCF